MQRSPGIENENESEIKCSGQAQSLKRLPAESELSFPTKAKKKPILYLSGRRVNKLRAQAIKFCRARPFLLSGPRSGLRGSVWVEISYSIIQIACMSERFMTMANFSRLLINMCQMSFGVPAMSWAKPWPAFGA